jgi:hypothetical protein
MRLNYDRRRAAENDPHFRQMETGAKGGGTMLPQLAKAGMDAEVGVRD